VLAKLGLDLGREMTLWSAKLPMTRFAWKISNALDPHPLCAMYARMGLAPSTNPHRGGPL
jgi:hypothetical protein